MSIGDALVRNTYKMKAEFGDRLYLCYLCSMGHAVAVRLYATSRKVAGSCLKEVDFSNLPNPSGCTMALESTQPLTEMSIRNLKKRNLRGKGGRRVGLTTLPPAVSRLSK
jgi:hypothetical protein